MKCLYCDKDYLKNSNFVHYVFTKDPLCLNCREKLEYKPKYIKVKDIKIYSLYKYNDDLKSMILQYKECNDEALKDVFFYDVLWNIRLKYHGYTIVWVPSTNMNKKRRGFDHMKRMIEILNMPMIDALEKIEEVSQNNLNKENREKMIGNIKVKSNIKLPPKVLLIDDIVTTGSSIYGSYLAIKDLVTKIEILSLAYIV